MNTMPPLQADEFEAYFRAVHDHPPFPWQARLARQVAERGWPELLDLPTGTGKTAALDVAVFALALDARRRPRSAPLRVVYVVDRRTIVDQAHERAERIRQKLSAADTDVLRRVRDRLSAHAQGGVPLRTALLRGGIARDDLWARTPDQPLIAISTVDQVGSRLLFRGYGVSDEMKPVHAGLLGADVLYLLDEVHLSQPFRETLTAVGERYRTWAERPIQVPFLVVEMSATPSGHASDVFRLDDHDRGDKTLAVRLRASKPVALASVAPKGFLREIEKHVVPMLKAPGATVAVVVNRVASARELHQRLRSVVPGGADVVHLLTGRMRPFDRDALEGRLLARIRSGRNRAATEKPVLVVSTQCIEAGADFDFDGMITECASLDALRQRFGRLDRLGQLAGQSQGCIVARTDCLEDDPVYGDAIGKTWDWLQARALANSVDFGIEALTVPADADEQGLLTPKVHAPVLLPSHLDAWAQTQPVPEPDPDVALWLHGPRRGAADIQIVWRADLTEDLLRRAVEGGADGKEAESVALGMVEALPPVSAEAMSVPFLAVRRWLEGKAEPESFDVEGAVDTDGDIEATKDDRPHRPAILWRGDQSSVIWGDALRPGQTIVVPAVYGGISFGNWAPASQQPVTDIAELAAFRSGRRPTMRAHPAVLSGLFGDGVATPTPESSDDTVPDDRAHVRRWFSESLAANEPGEAAPLIERLRREGRALKVERLPLAPGEDAGEYFLVTGGRMDKPIDDAWQSDAVSTEGAGASFTGLEVTLAAHLDGVSQVAAAFGERLGMTDDLVSDLRLAGQWHDAGKADPRFQRWLHGGSEFKALVQSEPIAKSDQRMSDPAARRRARLVAGYPGGARHELMSLVLTESVRDALAPRASDWPLVQHLIASHHGYCRPLAPWCEDEHPVTVAFAADGIQCSSSSAHELARLDSGVAERYWQLTRKYGWWGLAWMETVLRLADHRQSAREVSGNGAKR